MLCVLGIGPFRCILAELKLQNSLHWILNLLDQASAGPQLFNICISSTSR